MVDRSEDCRFHEQHRAALTSLGQRFSENDNEHERQWKEIDRRPRIGLILGFLALIGTPLGAINYCNLTLNQDHAREMKQIRDVVGDVRTQGLLNKEKLETISRQIEKMDASKGK